MAVNDRRVESTRVPYAPITVMEFRGTQELLFEALVDTGYTAFVVVPRGSFTTGAVPFRQHKLQLADDSIIYAPVYWGSIRIGDTVLSNVYITELGEEAIIGMRVISRFRLTIDHGRTLVLDP